MFRPFVFVGVASAAIIESRPHEHLQMANAQLQNATDAVIKTAAVAGLAYAGAYMAGLEAGMTTSGSSYDSSRKSQESSTGARYCNTRERDPLKYRCTAEYFNGKSVNGPDVAGGAPAVLAIRDYWCCQSSDLGDEFQGALDGTCVGAASNAAGWAQDASGATYPSTCVYQGPCNVRHNQLFAPGSVTGASTAGGAPAGLIGSCSGSNNLGGGGGGFNAGIFGGTPTPAETARLAAEGNPVGTPALGSSAGNAFAGANAVAQCCILESEVTQVETAVGNGDMTTSVAYDPASGTLTQPTSFCISQTASCPTGYINALINNPAR